jgi:trimeric autotransporter adhesin
MLLTPNTTASNNTAVGYQALYANTEGESNMAIGYFALGSNVSGNYNISIGQNSGQLATGTGNVFCGYASGANTTSGYNTFAGYAAGNAITTGGKNTILGGYTGNQGGLDIRTSSNNIVLSDGDGNPRGIFDGSGNFLVGKTAFDTSTAGFEARSTGFIGVTRADVGAYFTRLTTDGEIIQFRKDGTTVGSIGCNVGSFAIGQSNTALGFFNTDRILFPATASGVVQDNAIDLGYSNGRFDDIYATNGTIQTSDRNDKQDIEVLSDAEHV